MRSTIDATLLAQRNRHLWRLFTSVKGWFIAGALALLVTNGLALRIPRELGAAVEHLRQADSPANIDVGLVESYAWTIALLAVGAAAARILSRIFTFNGARIIEHRLRNTLFNHLTRLDPPFFQRSATGDLVSRITNDVTNIRLLYGISTLHIVNTTVAYSIVLTMMLNVSVELTLYALAPYPFFLLSVRWFTRAIYTRTRQGQELLSQVSARAQENLAGVAVIRAFGSQYREMATFRAVSDAYLERNLALARVRGGLNPFMGAISGIGTLLILGVGGTRVINETMTLGQYVEFSGYIVALAFPTLAMGWVLSVWNRGTAAFDRLQQVLQAQPEVRDPDPATATPIEDGEALGELAFEGVGLTYSDGTRALEDIDLRIPEGSRVAFVGRTGAGKSSLVQLIARLRDPTEGRITLGGRPLQQIPLQDLRGQVGVVPQDPFLFSMSIEENVRLGEPSAPRQRSSIDLKRALRVAHIQHDIEAMPQGLETPVGERGITLSGGQKQRLTIARAVLKAPRLLILDDALASVDTATEREIINELDQIMAGRTSILVTHRYNALELVDTIFVLDKGRLVERGSHEALLTLGGLYKRLYDKQMAEQRDEDALDPRGDALGDES